MNPQDELTSFGKGLDGISQTSKAEQLDLPFSVQVGELLTSPSRIIANSSAVESQTTKIDPLFALNDLQINFENIDTDNSGSLNFEELKRSNETDANVWAQSKFNVLANIAQTGYESPSPSIFKAPMDEMWPDALNARNLGDKMFKDDAIDTSEISKVDLESAIAILNETKLQPEIDEARRGENRAGWLNGAVGVLTFAGAVALEGFAARGMAPMLNRTLAFVLGMKTVVEADNLVTGLVGVDTNHLEKEIEMRRVMLRS